MDFGGLLILALLWVVFNVMGKKRPDGGRLPGGPPRPPGSRGSLPPAGPPEQGDATQREGSRLEALLRQLERAMDEAGAAGASGRPSPRPPAPSGPLGRPATVRLPGAEEVEERTSQDERRSLEEAPEVVSLEHEVARPARRHLSQDDTAEQLVARRIAAADARSGAHTKADHVAFDQRIRREPADATAVRMPGREALRRAIVWREVLGPPVSLRDPEP